MGRRKLVRDLLLLARKPTLGTISFSQQHHSVANTRLGLTTETINRFRGIGESKNPVFYGCVRNKGYVAVKDEISGTTGREKQIPYDPSPELTGERSTGTEITSVPSKLTRWYKKWWETLKGEGNRIFEQISRLRDRVVEDSWEIFEQDKGEGMETRGILYDCYDPLKEIRSRDPSFSLAYFLAEIEDIVKPLLNAYIKGDAKTLKIYCTSEVIQQCTSEHEACQNLGIFFDNKILHISDIDIKETKMLGSSPLIIVQFQTQQEYCVVDKHGEIVEGGKDTIHNVHYEWAMLQLLPEELGEGAIRPVFMLREMRQILHIGTSMGFALFFPGKGTRCR